MEYYSQKNKPCLLLWCGMISNVFNDKIKQAHDLCRKGHGDAVHAFACVCTGNLSKNVKDIGNTAPEERRWLRERRGRRGIFSGVFLHFFSVVVFFFFNINLLSSQKN